VDGCCACKGVLLQGVLSCGIVEASGGMGWVC
jgi:hypothetical protein